MGKQRKNRAARVYIILAVLAVVAASAAVLWQGREPSAPVVISPEITPSPSPTPTATPSPSPEPTPEPTPTPVPIPVDFDYLQGVNSDVVGWITVDGTGIDYPVLWDASEDYYYLHHTYEKEYLFAGSIFMTSDNSRDFSDRNTVLYGHNMKDDSMFAQIHRFEDREFFDENRNIVIYTNHGMITYEVFAAYKTDNLLITGAFDFSTEDGYREYLAHVFSHSGHFRDDITVTTADRIITLSTCVGDDNYRYVVQGILLSEQPGE